eukprot:352500-Chlamydomonas_euryale.AAC.4
MDNIEQQRSDGGALALACPKGGSWVHCRRSRTGGGKSGGAQQTSEHAGLPENALEPCCALYSPSSAPAQDHSAGGAAANGAAAARSGWRSCQVAHSRRRRRRVRPPPPHARKQNVFPGRAIPGCLAQTRHAATRRVHFPRRASPSCLGCYPNAQCSAIAMSLLTCPCACACMCARSSMQRRNDNNSRIRSFILRGYVVGAPPSAGAAASPFGAMRQPATSRRHEDDVRFSRL